jgi:hypothetical protein
MGSDIVTKKTKTRDILICCLIVVALATWYYSRFEIKNAEYEMVTTHGEFPFAFEYEKGDQRYTVEDTLILDYVPDGFPYVDRLKSQSIEHRGERCI